MPDSEDEPIHPEPFIFETDPIAQEEAATQEPTSPIRERLVSHRVSVRC